MVDTIDYGSGRSVWERIGSDSRRDLCGGGSAADYSLVVMNVLVKLC